ncbi:MAG: phosphatase PAP2 family protein, partial [Burkholderiales bacterium]|nr:phosphatase PAP2 family protein [Burkholderiales bacterium]
MNSARAWLLFTRVGEAQMLLPAMAAALAWLWLSPESRALAKAWVGAGLLVTAVTTASKVGFIGYELGAAAIDFTGFSGHSMFAALILPVLARIAAGRAAAPWPRIAVALGYALAAAIAYSRIVTQAHSTSEAWSGLALGGAASAWSLLATRAPGAGPPAWLLAVLLAWMLAMPVG